MRFVLRTFEDDSWLVDRIADAADPDVLYNRIAYSAMSFVTMMATTEIDKSGVVTAESVKAALLAAVDSLREMINSNDVVEVRHG